MSFWLKNIVPRALDLVLPPLCLLCDEPVGRSATLCPECWGRIHFVARPFCERCGTPFDIPVEDGTLCGRCLSDPPAFVSARSAMLYDDASRALVLGFKHADRTHAAPALAVWMHRAGRECLKEADALVPVPLHRWRLLRRRYNQSALLAAEVGKLAQKPVLYDGLFRRRDTPTQGQLKRKDRQENVKGAFRVNPSCVEAIQNKTLVLIDDVLTTGATVDECARTLLSAKVKSVHVLTLSRVKTVV